MSDDLLWVVAEKVGDCHLVLSVGIGLKHIAVNELLKLLWEILFNENSKNR